MRRFYVILLVLGLALCLGCVNRSAVQQTDIVSAGGISAGVPPPSTGTPVLWQGEEGKTVSGMWFGNCTPEGALLIVTTEQTVVAIPEELLVKLPGQGGGGINVTNVQTVSQGKAFPIQVSPYVDTEPGTAAAIADALANAALPQVPTIPTIVEPVE